IISFLLAGFFYPDLVGMLMNQFKSRHTLFFMMGLGIGILVMSTLITSIWSVLPSTRPGTAPSTDVLIIAAAVIIFMVVLMIAASVGRGGM
ncbi:MAG: hypothetical protein QXX38_03470, partial [Candidatus Aenigmatarchaeota archaeon]